MVDIFRSTHTDPVDPYEDIKIHGIEENRSDKEKFSRRNKKKGAKTTVFEVFFFSKIKKFLFNLLFGKKEFSSFLVLKMPVSNLFDLLSTFCEKDCSQELPLLQLFSLHWKSFLKSASKVEKNSKLYKKLQQFIQSVQNYPHEEENSLGYYLNAFNESEWIPYPYISLIKNLYQEFTSDPEKSTLVSWLNELEEIVAKSKELDDT